MGQVPDVDGGGPDIDRVLGDYTRQHIEDPTGAAELYPVLATTKQVYDAARISGFSESQAMQLSRDYFVEFLRAAVAQSQ